MISPDIDPDQTIYRFMNFFDIYTLTKEKQTRFTKLHKLDDKNEGLGKILRSIELAPAFPPNLRNQKDVEYPIIKHTTYVSCWTTVPDNIAMWMLYSPDQSGMRIKTTVSKLYATLVAYKKKYPANANKIDDFQPSQIDVFGMDYKNLRKAKCEIEANVATAVEAMREAIKGKSKSDGCRAWYKTMREHLKDYVLENDAMKYKDENYSHEQEIRGQIEFEASSEDEDGPDYMYDYMLDCDFKGIPNFIWLTVDENFIEEICIDPRCMGYKKAVFKEIIDLNGKLDWVESEAFGEVLKTTSNK